MRVDEYEHGDFRVSYSPIQTSGGNLLCAYFRDMDQGLRCCAKCHQDQRLWVVALDLERIKFRYKTPYANVVATTSIALICCELYMPYFKMVKQVLEQHNIDTTEYLHVVQAILYGEARYGKFRSSHKELDDQEGVILL